MGGSGGWDYLKQRNHPSTLRPQHLIPLAGFWECGENRRLGESSVGLPSLDVGGAESRALLDSEGF